MALSSADLKSLIQSANIDPETKKVVQAVLDNRAATVAPDLNNLRTSLIGALAALDDQANALNDLATKLNQDAGVADNNYKKNNFSNNSGKYAPPPITTT